MKGFLTTEIDKYISEHTSRTSDILLELERETWQKVLQPIMLVGDYPGRVLSFLSKMIRPEKILEIGTFTGYSAICLAQGLKEGGVLHTIDINEELQDIQQKYWGKAGIENQVQSHLGNALEIVPTLDHKFDIVFIDADKSSYLEYYEMCLDKLTPNGLIMIDNVLWFGKVTQEAEPNDRDTQILQELNIKVANDDRVEVIMLPIGDGLSVIRKKS